MERTAVLFACGLVAGTCYLSTTFETSFAFDKPLHTTGVSLLLSGLVFIAHGTFTFTSCTGRIPHKEPNNAVQLSDGVDVLRVSLPPPSWQRVLARCLLDVKGRVTLMVLLLCIICMRLAIYQRVMKDVECAGPAAWASLPLVLALFHAWQSSQLPKAPRWNVEERMKVWRKHLVQFVFCDATRYILPSLLLALGGCLTSSRASLLRSSYICPTANRTASLIPKLQILGFLVDCAAVIALYPLFHGPAAHMDNPLSDIKESARDNVFVGSTFVVGHASAVSSAILAVSGMVVYTKFPEHRHWLLVYHAEYISSLVSLSFGLSWAVFCFICTVSFCGLMSTVLLIGFSVGYTQIVKSLFTRLSYALPSTPSSGIASCFIALTIAFVLYVVSHLNWERSSRPKISIRTGRYPMLLMILILVSFLIGKSNYSLGRRQRPFPLHPITTLVRLANLDHEQWAAQAHQSESLVDAVKHYQERYLRDPPPGFDKWYEYAISRSSVVIDDFDNIDDDLAIFWSLSPSELRFRTSEILADEESSLGGISIRNGKAEVFANVPGTHRWMVDGAIEMIQKFVEHLPDMDLAMNLNDECRIAVPYSKRVPQKWQPHLGPGSASAPIDVMIDFSPDRASTWPNISTVPKGTGSRFTANGFNPSFRTYGSVTCPPSARARRESQWNLRSLCADCASPHSMGAFVANWTLSANPCHQPDLANLHGLHLSPSALVGTHDIVPVFSQSRAPGYADIRYPSPWNYVDKILYAPSNEYPDPPFVQKEDKLFWRGATTEGVSAGNGAWKGMLRQRLVHLVNNETESHPILLSDRKRLLRYVLEEPSTIEGKLVTKLDVRFVNDIVRCGEPDCTDQEREFGFGNGVDFQQHWRYRYLFDADGAGFSGRFLPFLQSNSVVFKTALFREWYEGRLKAWKHFVPVDLRLHDLWSIVAFIGGWGSEDEGAWSLEGDLNLAERIARDSRVWVEKALRKEDMEVYFFRLLLEWGRLTDDKRAEVGYRISIPKRTR